jgi:hypothetical protein
MTMELLVSTLGPFAALVGVWLGGWLTSRSARQAMDAEQRRRSMEDLRRAYSAYLTACRQFADYLKQPANKVEVVRSLDGVLEVPLLSPEGAALRQAVEAASADLLLMARSPTVVEQARVLRIGVIKLAIARAVSPDGIIADRDVTVFRTAEQAYVNAVREDMGMPPMDVSLWTTPPETARRLQQKTASD